MGEWRLGDPAHREGCNRGDVLNCYMGSLGKPKKFSPGDDWKKKEVGLGRWREGRGHHGRTDAFTHSLENLKEGKGMSQTTRRA